jgi:hypothetical protein
MDDWKKPGEGIKPKVRRKIKKLKYYYNKIVRRISIDSPPVFIVGCGHSGTTLLLSILGSHSRIYAIPYESEFALDYQTPRRKNFLIQTFEEQAIAHAKHRWIEKTPKHINYIETLIELCPDAKIILVIRDGRDVACSLQDRFGDLSVGIERWVSENRHGQNFWNHPNTYVFRYEQLIEDFEESITSVLDFIGEELEPDLRHYYKTPKKIFSDKIELPSNVAEGENHNQYRNWQINQPLFDSRGKWKRMTSEEKQLFKHLAGDMLVEYGYADDHNW